MNIIGRKVKALYHGGTGTILRWEPLGMAMCDTLLALDGGGECWFALSDLRPIDGGESLPDRREVLESARVQSLAALKEIKANHIRDFNVRWPGMEFAKAIFGNAVVGAIKELERQG